MPITTVNGCAYVLRVASGYYKIGVSIDPVSRMRDFQTGNHERIVFMGGSLPAPDGQRYEICAYAFERTVHQLLAGHHRCGEWFLVTFDNVVRAWRRAYATLLIEARQKEKRDGGSGE